jgi:membrane protease YdiL (CAAX protease family)
MSSLTFVLFTYAWSWAWWIPAVLFYRNTTPTPNLMDGIVPILIGAYGPTITAITLTALREGWPGVRALLRKYVMWRAGGGAWAVALLAPMAGLFVAIWIYSLQGHSVGAFDASGALRIPLILAAALPFGPLAEELGWRGYLQPRLMVRTSPAATSLIIGAIWTFWHAPLYWAPAGTSISGEPVTLLAVLFYLVEVTALAFLFTWVWLRSDGSVLLAVALHLTFNASLAFAFFPALAPAPGSFVASHAMKRINELAMPVLWAGVALLLITERDRWFRRPASA